jgi:hypothetical protein
VDLVADNFVSWMAMIDGGSWGLAIKSCKQGIAVLSEDAFQVMAYVSRLVRGIGTDGGVELRVGVGLGNVYSGMGSLYLNASVRSRFGRYGNASCKFCMLGGSWFRCM